MTISGQIHEFYIFRYLDIYIDIFSKYLQHNTPGSPKHTGTWGVNTIIVTSDSPDS